MSVDTGIWSVNQFRLGYIAEATIGTAAITSGGSETLQAINIAGLPSFNWGVNVNNNIRNGVGRTKKVIDVYTTQSAQLKEISFTAIYDQTVATAFLRNVIGASVGSSPASYDIAYNEVPTELLAGAAGDISNTMTLGFYTPESYSTIIPGCVVKSLRFYTDVTQDGGRFMMDVVIQTKGTVSNAADGSSWTFTAPPTTFREIYNAATKVQINAVDVELSKYELTINNNVKFYGFNASGEPITIAKGLPNFDVTGLFTAKFDNNLDDLFNGHFSGSNIEIEISNNATWASATFGFKANYGRMVSQPDLTEVENGAFIDIPLEFFAHTSGDIIQIIP